MAITKQINYQVKFNSDTSNVKNALANLQQTLNGITTKPITFDDGSITKAIQDAKELQSALQKATNVDTGKLNLTKFSQELKTNKKTLADYTMSLKQLGPQGQQAFIQMAQAIGKSEIALRKTNNALTQMGITLKNTIRWQLSSSLIQGFTSAVSNAVRYTQDLDEALNNIRIVSDKNVASMEKFAERANQAAKDLAAGTLDYANASLIYYQQGLSDAQVKERTDATVKMANVTGEAAKEVSSYMTAIWNNFDDGSKKLEYYTDVMTALGAATAASTDEIATGLEKFAGIAETVGLSYEYATAAVTTLVDKTRQSPETIGTAMKTIFSRLQGLKLGETLDDGTDLNKYSEALATVGVNIKDQYGSLKKMDQILDDLGSKWNLISNDQQVALAQTLGGARQYTQIMSMMSNWDSFQANVDIAKNAEGTLEKQQQIYRESWEAVRKETQASLEGLYSEIIPEETLIDFSKTMGSMADSLAKFIEGFGGIESILSLVTTMLVSKFLPSLMSGGQHLLGTLKSAFSFSNDLTLSFTRQAQEQLRTSGIMDETNSNYQQQLVNVEKILQLQEKKLIFAKSLTSEKKAQIDADIERLQKENAILEIMYKQEEASRTRARETTDIVRINSSKTAKEVETGMGQIMMAASLRGTSAELGIPTHEAGVEEAPGFKKLSNLDGQGAKKWGADFTQRSRMAYSQQFGVSADQFTESEIGAALETKKAAEIDMASKSFAKLTGNAGQAKSLADGNRPKDAVAIKKTASRYQFKVTDLERYLNTLETIDKKYEILTKEGKGLAKSLDDMKKAVDGIIPGNNDEQKQITALKNAINNLGDTAQSSATEIENAGEANVDIENLDANVTKEIEATKTDAYNAGKNNTKNIKTDQDNAELAAVEEYNKKAEIASLRTDAITSSIQGVTTAFSSAAMMIQSIQSLGSIWSDENTTTGEKILSTVMAITMAFSSLTGIMQGVQMLDKGMYAWKVKNLMITRKMTQADAVKALATEAAQKKEQAGDKISIIGKIAKGWADAGPNPAKLITMAAVTALVATLVGVALANVSAKKEDNEQKAEQDYEIASKAIEEAKKNKDKLISYQEALAEYNEETGEGKEALAEQAEALAEAYNIEGAALARLTGNYKEFSRKVNEAILEENAKVINQTTTSINSLEQYIRDKDMLEKGDGGDGGDFFTGGTGTYEETFESSYVSEDIANLAKSHNLNLFSGSGKNFSIIADNQAEAVWQIYKLRSLIMEDSEKYGEDGQSLVKELDEDLKNIDSETLDKIIELFTAQEDSNLSTALIKTEKTFGKEVKTISDYLDFKDKFIEQSNELGIATDSAEEYFNTLSQFKEIRDLNQALEDLGIDDEKRRNYLQELAKDDYNLLLHPTVIPLLKEGTNEELTKEIGELKLKASVSTYDVDESNWQKFVKGEISFTDNTGEAIFFKDDKNKQKELQKRFIEAVKNGQDISKLYQEVYLGSTQIEDLKEIKIHSKDELDEIATNNDYINNQILEAYENAYPGINFSSLADSNWQTEEQAINALNGYVTEQQNKVWDQLYKSLPTRVTSDTQRGYNDFNPLTYKGILGRFDGNKPLYDSSFESQTIDYPTGKNYSRLIGDTTLRELLKNAEFAESEYIQQKDEEEGVYEKRLFELILSDLNKKDSSSKLKQYYKKFGINIADESYGQSQDILKIISFQIPNGVGGYTETTVPRWYPSFQTGLSAEPATISIPSIDKKTKETTEDITQGYSTSEQISAIEQIKKAKSLISLFGNWNIDVFGDYNTKLFKEQFNRIIKENYKNSNKALLISDQILQLQNQKKNLKPSDEDYEKQIGLIEQEIKSLYEILAIEEQIQKSREEGVLAWAESLKKYSEELEKSSGLSNYEIENIKSGMAYEANRILNTNFFTTDNISTYLPQITAMAKGSETAFMQLQDAIIETWAALEDDEAYEVFKNKLGLAEESVNDFKDAATGEKVGLEGFRKALQGIFTAAGDLDAEAFTNFLSGLESTEDKANTVLGILSMFSTVVPDYIETTIKTKVSIIQDAPLKTDEIGNYYNIDNSIYYRNTHGNMRDSGLEAYFGEGNYYADTETQYTENAAFLIKDAHLRGNDYYKNLFTENGRSELYTELIQTEDIVQAGQILATEIIEGLQRNKVSAELGIGVWKYKQKTVAENLDDTGVGFLFVGDTQTGAIGIRTDDKTKEQAMAESLQTTQAYLKDFFNFLNDNSGGKTFSLSTPSYQADNFNYELETIKNAIQDLQDESDILKEKLENLIPGEDTWKTNSNKLITNLKNVSKYYDDIIANTKIAKNNIKASFEESLSYSTIDASGISDSELEKEIKKLFENNDIFSEIGRATIKEAMSDINKNLDNNILAKITQTGLAYKKDDSGAIVLDSEALMGAQYSTLRALYNTYQQNKKNLDAATNFVNQYLSEAEKVDEEEQKAILKKLQNDKNIRNQYLSDAQKLSKQRQKDNELAEAEIEKLTAKFGEEDFSEQAMANRQNIYQKEIDNVKNALLDAQADIKDLELIPEEFRGTEWADAYNEAISKESAAQAEFWNKERENTEAVLNDIIGKYEQLNTEIDNLKIAYDNFISTTEDFQLFENNGEISSVYNDRMAAKIELVTLAQNRLTNAQKSYTEVYNKAKADGVITNEEQLILNQAKATLLKEEASLVKVISAAYEELTTVIEKYNDEIDKQQEKLDAIVEITEAYISTLETLGERFNIGKVLQPEALQKLQETSLEMAITNVKVAKQQRDAQKGIVEQLDKKLALVKDNELQYNKLLVVRDEAASKLIETETNLASVMSESISQATELFETNIDRILTTMKDALAGDNFGSLDELQTAYDRAEETSKRYLDTTKQEYELSKLRRTINSQINANTAEVANAKLRDILEDINKIEKDNLKMSEYDLKMLNAKYELYKAQIALEEAQNNKSQIRLQRNASGNWSYVFTADQGKIDQAAQKVEDAQYKIYNDSQQYLEQTQKNVLTLQQEWTAALEEIYKDATLSEEERIAKINQTNQYYAGQLSYFGNELSKTLNNTGINFEDTIYGMIANFESFNEAQNEIVNSIAEGIASMEAETDKLASNIKGTMEDAGESFNTFGDKVAELANPNNENGLIKNFNTIADNIGNMCTKISKALEPVLTQLNTLTNIKTNVELPAKKTTEDTKNKYEEDYSSLISDYKNQYDAETEPSIRREILYAAQKSNKMRNQKIKDLGLKEKQVTDEDIKNWFQGTAPAPFDTGGYTGDWGSEGKLAVLHEKELILNKEDTKKILSAVEIARMITGNALGQMGNLANAFYVNKYTAKPQELQQNVHIEASFPGVQSAFEIETALKNIVNDVSQYVEIDK